MLFDITGILNVEDADLELDGLVVDAIEEATGGTVEILCMSQIKEEEEK